MSFVGKQSPCLLSHLSRTCFWVPKFISFYSYKCVSKNSSGPQTNVPFKLLFQSSLILHCIGYCRMKKVISTDSDSDDETVLGDLGDQPKASEASASSGGCGLGPNPVEVPVSPDSPEPVPTVPMAAEPVPTAAEPVPTAAPAPAASVTSTSAPAPAKDVAKPNLDAGDQAKLKPTTYTNPLRTWLNFWEGCHLGIRHMFFFSWIFVSLRWWYGSQSFSSGYVAKGTGSSKGPTWRDTLANKNGHVFLTFGVTFGVIWGKEKGQLLV